VACLRQLELGSVSSRVSFRPSSDRDNCLIRVSSSTAQPKRGVRVGRQRTLLSFLVNGTQGIKCPTPCLQTQEVSG